MNKILQRVKVMRSYKLRVLAVALIGVGILGCMGGQGATDGGSGKDPDFRDDVFVGDDATSGSIDLRLDRSQISVGETAGFQVYVTDAQGQPVPNINVVCDSEQGVAIIEPNTGFELTNSAGVMNGVIGCAAPGSFQMVCRLNIGANRREFASVNCSGEIPSGFTGFPGSAGGGLGGGTQTNDDGEVRILEAGFSDDGTLSGDDVPSDATVDISQDGDCDNDAETVDSERFYDTYAVLKVRNNLAERVTLLYLTCSVTGVDGSSDTADCGTIGLTRQADATIEGNSSTNTIFLPVFKAGSGGKYVGNPSDGTGTQITSTGLYTVSFKLYYQRASDEDAEPDIGDELSSITASATASFGNFDRCGAGN